MLPIKGQERGLQAERTSLTEALVAARSSNAELRTETEQNHSRIAALSAEVEARTRQVTATQLAQAIAMDDAAVARASVVALESTREQLQNEVSRLTALTLEHETRFAESTKALLAVQGSSDEVSTRLTAALAEVAHLKAELEAGLDARVVERALLTKTESERDAATNELATLKAAISERDAEVLRLSASLSELETTKQSVESQQSSLQLQLTAIQEQLATSKAQGVELEQKLTGLTTELQETAARATRIDAALESTKQEHQATLMALREELEAARASATRALEAKASEADATLAERDARIAALETSNTERVAATEAAQAGLSAARAAAEQKASEQAQALASLGEQLAEAKANIGRAQSEARGHQLGKQQNQVEIERLKAELATAQSSLSAVGGETKSIIAAREAIESTAQETAQKLKLAEDERGALAAQLATAAQERSALAAKVEALQVSAAQLDVVTQERTALSEKVEALEASAAQATAEATKTRAELQANEEERAALAMKLEAEIKAVDDERTSLAIQVQSLQSSLAQANADVLEATKPIAPGEEWGVYRERIQSLEAQLEASQTAGTTDATARRQAEELLLLLREKYGDLQHELSQATEALIALRRDTGRTAALVEQVSELQTENVLIEQERERLAQRVEELERELQLPLAAEFDNPTRPYQIPLDVPPLEEPRLPGVARQRRTPTGEFEIFELDVDDSGLAGEAEEIVLLEEEATDPGRKKPEKK